MKGKMQKHATRRERVKGEIVISDLICTIIKVNTILTCVFI